MNKVILGAALVAFGVIGGVVAPMLIGNGAISAQDKDPLNERVMDAKQIRERIAVIKGQLKEGDESLDQLKLRSELSTLEAALEADGENAKIYTYDGDDSNRPQRTLLFDAKGLGSGFALKAAPESFQIVEVKKDGMVLLLDSRTGDTWVYTPTDTRGIYWEPLPRSAERYNLVPHNYAAESGFKESEVEHRHRREQIMEMMEELNRELEEMKSYEKR